MYIERMSGQGKNFYRVLSNEDVDETRDDYSLGLHLMNEHNSIEREDFNRHFKVQILENCSPSNLEKNEHLFIHLRICILLGSIRKLLDLHLQPSFLWTYIAFIDLKSVFRFAFIILVGSKMIY